MDPTTSKHGKLVRIKPDDEIVATGCDFHMERMDAGHIWLCISGGPANARWCVDINLHAQGRKLNAVIEQ